MNRFVKLGYILVGAGLGMFAATLMYENELRKPIGDIEEYIPTEDREEDKEDSNPDVSPNDADSGIAVDGEFSKADTHILDYYKSDVSDSIGAKNLEARAKKRREEFERARANGRNQTTRYSQMYEGDADDENAERERRVAEMLQAQRDANADFNRRMDEKNRDILDKKRDEEYMAYLTQESNMPDDIPSDDDIYEDDSDSLDNELVRERVENNFEIYLGENPQEFVSLIFYEGDNTLTDDRDRVVPAADEVVGLVALSRLIEGGPGAENGVIFVRNLKTMINYEVTLDAGSYSETVLGIFNSRHDKGAGGDGNRRRDLRSQ